jgi:hypothetical protein
MAVTEIIIALLLVILALALTVMTRHYVAPRLTFGGLLSPTKRCPHCAETIRAAAKICRFCGRDV